MYTDRCQIINVTVSAQYGVATESETFISACRVEENPKSSNSGIGSEKEHRGLFILPPYTNISNGDKLRATVIRGVSVTRKYVTVQKSFNVGSTSPHHIEVWTAGRTS